MILLENHVPSPNYQLVGVIENTGLTPDSGHCIAYRRLFSENGEQWIKCDDSIVTEVEFVKEIKKRAMVLLYEQ